MNGPSIERKPSREYLPLHLLRQEMPALPVLDLDHPEVGVVAALALDIGVQFALHIADDGLNPQGLAVHAGGLGIEARSAVRGVVGLDDHGPAAWVALLDHGGVGAFQFGAADQGAGPDVGGKKQFANPDWTRDRNLAALGSSS